MIPAVASWLAGLMNAGGTVPLRELKIRGNWEYTLYWYPSPPAWKNVTLRIIAWVYCWLTTRQLEGFAGAVGWMLQLRVCSLSQTNPVNFTRKMMSGTVMKWRQDYARRRPDSCSPQTSWAASVRSTVRNWAFIRLQTFWYYHSVTGRLGGTGGRYL